MKNIISLSVLALFSLGLFAACCGSSGPSCEDVCNKMVECDQESDLTDCVEQCAIFKDAFRDDVYSELGDCYMEKTCAQLEDGEICFNAAAALGSEAAAMGLVDDMCAAYVDCDDTGLLTQEDCVDGMLENAGDALPMIGMFKDSVISCAGNCIGDLSCEELDDDNSMQDCMENCGLVID